MGFSKELERSKRVLRIIKTLFFLIYMIFSFLIVSAPVLLVIADMILPTALFSASLSSSSSSSSSSSPVSVSVSVSSVSDYFAKYDFSQSLIDIPLISIIRSAVILIVYSLCDGPRLSRGPYLGITTICSLLSLVFVSVKASYVSNDGGCEGAMKIALFVCSLAMGVGHVIVAYRISCRERRKLLVYKIDIEAVAAWKVGLAKYHKHSPTFSAKKNSPTRKSEVKDLN